ncbi:MAG: hypothetical protein FVQ82_04245 [Planctomycetes bacterium]|nr:hypothetical protein [Planctomycetota bacterium]
MYWLICLIFGAICAAIGSSKGRSAIGWFFVGFFLGIIGLIIACVASNVKDARQKEIEMQNEQRRLREQLRQERIKNDQFRNHAQQRLDKHDDALGIETRSIQELPDIDTREKLNDGYIPIEPTIWDNVQEDEPLI